MELLIIFVSLLLSTSYGNPADQGPQTFNSNLQVQTKQKIIQIPPRYVMKEVIMYLTPTQIRAFHNKGLIDSKHIATLEQYVGSQQGVNQKQIPLQGHSRYVKQEFSRPALVPRRKLDDAQNVQNQPTLNLEQQSKSEPYIFAQRHEEQSQYEYTEPINKNQPRSYTYIHFFTDLDKQSSQRTPKLQLFQPQIHDKRESPLPKQQHIEIQTDPLLQQKYQLVPYEYVADKNIRIPHEYSNIEQNIQYVNSDSPNIQSDETKSAPYENDSVVRNTRNFKVQDDPAHLQYAPKFNDEKYVVDVEKIIRNIELQKQNAEVKFQAIANSPPIVVNRDINIIKHRPISLIKHVQIPVPTPVFVPVPEPFEVKVPQPYPVPLEIVRPIPIPIVKTEKLEVEKPVPVEVEKRIPVPVEKKVYVKVDKPYPVERIVPVEVKKEVPVEVTIHKPEKLTILRHIWDHSL